MASKRLIHVRLTDQYDGRKVDGFTASTALEAALTVVDLSRVIDAYKVGHVRPATVDIFVLPRWQREPAADAKPTASFGVQRFEDLRAFAKGFDAGRAV